MGDDVWLNPTLVAERDKYFDLWHVWMAQAYELAEAVRLWLNARDNRRLQEMPFGATPLTHPEIFDAHLRAAQEANAAMAKALADYDARLR